VALVKNGELVLEKGYGYRAQKEQLPVETDTSFAIGSVTKQFTCACVLLLAEDGKLSPDDRVAKYFPKLNRANEVTLLDLMNHTSGYRDYYPLDFVDRRMQKPISPDKLIQQYAGPKLDFAPGTDWSYSNTGFIILGRIVEMVSGESFGEFLEKRILVPLRLEHTSLGSAKDSNNSALGYTTFALSAPERVLPEAPGWIGAAGAIYSTVGDLARWDLALTGGRVLNRNYLRLMTTPRELSNGIVTAYGCGIGVAVQDRRVVLRHSGAVSGFNAFNAIIPSIRSALVLLCNRDGGLGSLPDVLTSLMLKGESNVPKVGGLTAIQAVEKVLSQFQIGALDRTQFGEEFNLYLTQEKVTDASGRLKRFGKLKKAALLRARERGGMEVTTSSVSFEKKDVEVLMYRTPEGRIEQFFIDEK
jgi:D-alanyl-D-alanine carboxypeptidase